MGMNWYINGIEMTSLDAYIKSGWLVTNAPVSRSIYSGGCANYIATNAKIGLKTISLSVRIMKNTDNDADEARSSIVALCLEKQTSIILPNGKHYVAVLTETGTSEKKFNGIIDFSLVFTGYERGRSIVNAITPYIFCLSTVPETPYRITATATGPTLSMAGIDFINLSAGDIITVDGMLGKITKNGYPMLISDAENFVKFPSLHPGQNTVSCDVSAMVEYYPIYM